MPVDSDLEEGPPSGAPSENRDQFDAPPTITQAGFMSLVSGFTSQKGDALSAPLVDPPQSGPPPQRSATARGRALESARRLFSSRGNTSRRRSPSPFQRLQPSPSTMTAISEDPKKQAFIDDAKLANYRRAKAGTVDDADVQSFKVLDAAAEKMNPQRTKPFSGRIFVRLFILANIFFSVLYLYWRMAAGTVTSIDGAFFGTAALSAPVLYYAWIFYACEVFLTIAVWIGHSERLFAVERPVMRMDDLAGVDESVGYNARVCVLLPTAGERGDIVLKALLGVLSQNGWDAGVDKSAWQRIIILDEKRRKGVLSMAAAMYNLATIIRTPELWKVLEFEGMKKPTPLYFYEWYKTQGGAARRHLYDDVLLNQACALLEFMETIAATEDTGKAFGLQKKPKGLKGKKAQVLDDAILAMLDALTMENVAIEPGFVQTFNATPQLPTLIYYSRKEPGTPRQSPKAGNMNAALFSVDYPDMPPLIGDSTIICVNDCRHQMQPEFLQRTCPYFFELDEDAGYYSWAKVAFVQTPQRFNLQKNQSDPLGNHAAMQYDVINHGKDGIGGVGSSGHGSLWRVASLQGLDASGNKYADPDDRSLIGHKLGFRSEMLIEDTHTSIEVFRAGWRSVYVNEPGEHLSLCTHQPNSINWRVKQVLRWHQGAVQLLLYKGLWYTTFDPRAKFPTVWHRIYSFDQATYYLQAFPGYMLLLMPIIYGVAGQSPFTAEVDEFFTYFTPFIVTAILPTAIMGQRRGVDSNRLSRDEQVWLSTTYVQLHAFFSMIWQTCKRSKGGDAWSVSAPTWPLFLAFFGEFAALAGGVFWLIHYGYDSWALNFFSVLLSACLAINSLWPMVAMHMDWEVPPAYYLRIAAYAFGGTAIVLVVKYATTDDTTTIG